MAKPLNVVLCWHMHQPYYREGLDGAYRLPWVYLHGIKDYSDMATHLERHPEMRAVVNFVPVLLEQLDDYASQLEALLRERRPTQDAMLNLLAGVESIPADPEARLRIIRDCQRAHAPRMIQPYPAFERLIGLTESGHDATDASETAHWSLRYLSEQYFLDLLTWYHLAWLGHSLRQEALPKRLMEQEQDFGEADRHALLELMQRTLAGLVPRYRALADRGQIELSMTPWGHPIVPLLNDFANMRDALPDAPAPVAAAYPGGAERARWHLRHGLDVFEHYFGRRPVGVWLAEGGISEDALAQLDEFDIRWTASGEGVWRNSCTRSSCSVEQTAAKRALFSPTCIDGWRVRVFFRDDGLSDLIGFKYSDWHSDDAVGDFIQHLDNIASFFGEEAGEHVVSIILDGENAWEYYPENGHYFLDALYRRLPAHPTLKIGTFADVTEQVPTRQLSTLAAGSWVYGSFSTWIGSEDKNRGWDLLVAAKRDFDAAVAAKRLDAATLEQAIRQLAVCEGSDWFWWFGDYNPAGSVSDFEQLFRAQLRELYRLIGVDAPVTLDVPLSHGHGQAENAGTMRRNVG